MKGGCVYNAPSNRPGDAFARTLRPQQTRLAGSPIRRSVTGACTPHSALLLLLLRQRSPTPVREFSNHGNSGITKKKRDPSVWKKRKEKKETKEFWEVDFSLTKRFPRLPSPPPPFFYLRANDFNGRKRKCRGSFQVLVGFSKQKLNKSKTQWP